MFQTSALEFAVLLAGAGMGWVVMFSFVAAPTAFRTFDGGRADRIVKAIIKNGHGVLAAIILLAAMASLFAGAIAGAVVAGVAAIFALCCQWALAPRTDSKPILGRKVYKTARIVASTITAAILPVLIAAVILMRLGI